MFDHEASKMPALKWRKEQQPKRMKLKKKFYLSEMEEHL
jgi:hypothetical protein